MIASWQENYDKPRQYIKTQSHHPADKGLHSQSDGFSSSQVQMWKSDHKNGREMKNWCFQTEVLEKTLLSPLDSEEIKPVNTEGNQPGIFIGRTDAKAEAPILWPPDANSLMKRPWCWERLKAEREQGDRGWEGGIALDSMDMNLGKLREMVREMEAWHDVVCGITNIWTQLGNWTHKHCLYQTKILNWLS